MRTGGFPMLRVGVGAVALALLAPTLPVGAGGPTDLVRVQLIAERSTVAQGEPIKYRLLMTSLFPSNLDGSVTMSIGPVGSGEMIPFARWRGTLYGLATFDVPGRVVPAQWFDQLGAFRLRASGSFRWGAAPNLPSLAQPEENVDVTVTAATVVIPAFEDMTDAVGLTGIHNFVPCANYSAGAAWADVEGDGDLDLYMPQNFGGSRLWINEQGSFVDRAAAAGVLNLDGIGTASSFADYDNDGDQDLYVVNNGPNRLYRNDGDGTFTDVTEGAGVGESGPGTSAAWGDYDADGFLDLYVTNHGRRDVCGPSPEFQIFSDALYHNNGNGTFTDVTDLLPSAHVWGLGFQAAWFDYDGDRDVDLYLANDRIRHADQVNALWRNDGPGANGRWVFTDMSVTSGAGIGINSMGIGVGDYNGDRRLDLGISNIGPTALLRNGTSAFTNRAAEAFVDRPMQTADVRAVTWAVVLADLNADGWEDMYVAAGELEPADELPEPQPNALFVNAGNGTFLDLSVPSATADPQASRGVATADYDLDGRLDMFVVNQHGQPRLYRNATQGHGAWLQVDTIGTASNRDGCGAFLTAETSQRTMVRQVLCGSHGLGSGSDPTAHFGLGSATEVRRLTIDWPSGRRQVLTDIAAGQLLTVLEP